MELSFKEISNWQRFENLIAAFFRNQKNEYNVIDVEVQQTGRGSDGGRDIVVKFQVSDSVSVFTRKWIIQCKFYNRDLRKSDIADVNIPGLIHQYKADGYLLVCKQGVVNTLSQFFEDLNKNCRFDYSYVFWIGDEFKEKLLTATDITLLKLYFPVYYAQYVDIINRSRIENLSNNN